MNIAKCCLPMALLGLVALPLQAAAQNCQTVSEQHALALFEQWNDSLKSGDPQQVAQLYQHDALLLPTVSMQPRLTQQERIDYFTHFLAEKPSGKLDSHHFQAACDTAILAGLYTFDLAASGKQVAARYSFIYRWNGQQWLISHHHSSLLPST
ncbi:SgcJ/EcaC family oxidoreductase [Pseudomonas plecoglossicida]|uniref:SgcJ/EcaC family oxidoreductase n=1 Tax=Pseudomonas plecoglossicida TaxID=70775 RepID=A0AAD0QUT0_PSEDL|nr:SgcJ/EcaC family oxidoreductase [Pseudomonas plecoglossicida]AXM95407.1 SgcJ/EcaC family oxidoreductase [Pseudomonas plecoglossicida]EPB96256.1 calcium/calmodulin dependent protein kinase II association-domain-containing protein [Pseudomonas plecoglossicida NB2011]QLB56153.1 SgcJ/EcaC family oxidoreductase [Pseudomonas plecoglossicida]GLR39186.1 cag pathogenicity island protein Cag5 [Pseudomonas plecoglossicida]